jgi:hypothetical protein
MNTTPVTIGWRFWLIWIIATFLGILAGRLIPFLILAYFEMHPLLFDNPAGYMIEISVGLIVLTSAVGLGIVVGIAQWSIVRRFLAIRAIAWLGVTILAFLIVILIQVLMKLENSTFLMVVLGSFIAGIVLGVLQWTILYKKIDRAFLWIGINLTCWTIAGLAIGILAGAIKMSLVRTLLSNIEFWGTLFSTLGLWWFLKKTTSTAELKAPEGNVVHP